MTTKSLIEKIIDIYSEARKTNFPNKNITRARSHTASSKVEDLFAYFFSNLTNQEIIIDKPISVILDEKRKTFYPDLSLKKNNIITNFYDIKMDLGWKRAEFPKYCVDKSEIMKQIRNQKVDFWGEQLEIDSNAKYEILIVSQLNISKKILEKNLQLIENEKIDPQVGIYFLTSDVHPNHGDSTFAKENIKINQNEFDELLKTLN
jgi:hypothetical protein